MIQVEIEQWQQLKAKLSRMQQQILVLKSQNEYLKNKLKDSEKISSKSSVNISIGSHLIDSVQQDEIQDDISQNRNNKKNKVKHQKNWMNRQKSTLKVIPDLLSSKDLSDYIKKSSNNSIELIPQKSKQKMNVSELVVLKGGSGKQKEVDEIIVSRQYQSTIPKQNQIIISRKSVRQSQLKHIISSRRLAQNNIQDLLPLLQDIAVYGPNLTNLNNITFKNDDRQLVDPILYYPTNKTQQYQQYGNYFYPKQVRVKPTQKIQIPMQANKTIFKNSKKQQCKIFIFQGNQSHPIKKSNQVLQKVNPSKWLYGLVMEFNDFVFKQTTTQNQISNHVQNQTEFSSPLLNSKKRSSLLTLDINNTYDQQIRLETVSLKDIQFEQQDQHMYRTNFSLCIFTYFPFISYLQNLLYAIFDQVKLKRIEQFPKTGKFKDCDIFYFIKVLNIVILQIKQYLLSNPVKMRKQIVLKINQNQLKLNLNQQNLYQQLYGKWAYKIVKMMDKDTLYQIYCMVMLEQSIYFICDDSTNLTFMIFLFASMLSQPFSYPYPVVSIIFSEYLLQTPFTSIIGINQSQMWFQQAHKDHLIDLQTKNAVIINEKQVKIKRKINYTPPKSDNLRKIISNFYKKTQPSSLSSIFSRKDTLPNIDDINNNNQLVLHFFVKLQLFFHDNIFSYLPNKMSILKMDGQLNKKNQQINKATIRNQIFEHIQRFYKRQNINYYKDQFIKQFVKTQIFSICLMEEYQIQ